MWWADQEFNYQDSKINGRTLHVCIYHNDRDAFRLSIEGRDVIEKKMNLKATGTLGSDMSAGVFDGDPVILSCVRDYTSITATWCYLSIGTGEQVKVLID